MTLGALEPKFWAAWCRGVGREDLIEKQFESPGSPAHAEVQGIFMERSREQWSAFAAEHDCCLEPVLDLDEALASDLVRERAMVIELDQPGARASGAPARRADQALAHAGDADRSPGPALGEQTDAVLRGLGYDEAQVARAQGGGRRRRAGQRRPGLLHGMTTDDGMLKMSELSEQSGVSAGTIKHYLREGLLPEPVRTSRNMAYYPPDFVERIRLIKRLQEERFMPLRVIKDVLDDDPERARRWSSSRTGSSSARSARRSRAGSRGPRSSAATRSPRTCSRAWRSWAC